MNQPMPFPIGYYIASAPMPAQYSYDGGINRKRPARVARLKSDKVESFSYQYQQQKVHAPQPTSSFPPATFQMGQHNLQVSIIGQVSNDCITFDLFPGSARSACPFNFTPSPAYKVVLELNPQISINFSLNDSINLVYDCHELDVTQYLRNGQNSLIFYTNELMQGVTAMIQWRLPDNLDVFVTMICNERPPMELAPSLSSIISDFCPISHSLINKPGRGCNCTHPQCFDLQEFLRRGLQEGIWTCPVCNREIPFEDLRYDPTFLPRCHNGFVFDEFNQDASLDDGFF